MGKRTLKTALVLIFSSILITGCNQKKEQNESPKVKLKNFDYGHVKNHQYVNPFFNFKTKLDKEWKLQEQSTLKEMQKRGTEIITDGNERLKSIVNRSQVTSVVLLGTFKYDIGAPIDFNPSLIIGAENLEKAPGIKKATDYLYHTKKLINKSNVNFKIEEKYQTTMIDNQLFSIMNLTMEHPLAGNIKQQYYVTILNRFVLYFVLSYSQEEEKKALLKMLNSTTF